MTSEREELILKTIIKNSLYAELPKLNLTKIKIKSQKTLYHINKPARKVTFTYPDRHRYTRTAEIEILESDIRDVSLSLRK